MNKDKLHQQAMNAVFWKLDNVLRGDAFLLKENRTVSDEERKARMDVIEELANYLRNYNENMRMITEYKEMQERLIDDGR